MSNHSRHRYFLLFKPYGVLSQFTREHPDHRTLGDLYDFPPHVYPVGRLDRDSEGLLLLTDDNEFKHSLLEPKYRHQRTYWVQVEGEPDEAALDKLRTGVNIRIKKKAYRTMPAGVQMLDQSTVEARLPERDPPIRFRKNVPDRWIALTLTEGKNRQVRRMCAAAGYPVLRLVRHRIGRITLDLLGDQSVRELSEEQARMALQRF